MEKLCGRRSFRLWFPLTALIIFISWSAAAGGSVELRELTVTEARDLIIEQQGRVRVVMIYAARCSRSRELFNDFIEASESWDRAGVSVLALATDRKRSRLMDFLEGRKFPFAPIRLRPWKSGDLDRAMSRVGIEIGRRFSLPLLAVIDRAGTVVYRAEGVSGLGGVKSAVERAL